LRFGLHSAQPVTIGNSDGLNTIDADAAAKYASGDFIVMMDDDKAD
jgi:hypothetical protein